MVHFSQVHHWPCSQKKRMWTWLWSLPFNRKPGWSPQTWQERQGPLHHSRDWEQGPREVFPQTKEDQPARKYSCEVLSGLGPVLQLMDFSTSVLFFSCLNLWTFWLRMSSSATWAWHCSRSRIISLMLCLSWEPLYPLKCRTWDDLRTNYLLPLIHLFDG